MCEDLSSLRLPSDSIFNTYAFIVFVCAVFENKNSVLKWTAMKKSQDDGSDQC